MKENVATVLSGNEAYVRNNYDGYDRVIRDLINQESTLVSTKVNWFILLQGLLFTIFSQFSEKSLLYSLVLSSVGLCVSLAMTFSFWTSEKAIAKILASWDHYLLRNSLSYEDFPPVFTGWGWNLSKFEKLINIHFARPYKFLAYVFIIAWLLTYLMPL